MTDGVNLQKHQTNVLEVKNLKKIYGPRTVVKDVSLSIKSGEVVGLLGPNGAGKTTTFYMIVGLVAANGGQILLNGESIQHLPIYKRARIGITYLPQENSVFRTLTVEENIQAILELQTNEDGSPFTKKQIKEELEKLLNELWTPTIMFAKPWVFATTLISSATAASLPRASRKPSLKILRSATLI